MLVQRSVFGAGLVDVDEVAQAVCSLIGYYAKRATNVAAKDKARELLRTDKDREKDKDKDKKKTKAEEKKDKSKDKSPKAIDTGGSEKFAEEKETLAEERSAKEKAEQKAVS